MTIAVGNKGTGAAGTTSATVTYPTVGSTSMALLLVGDKPFSSVPTVDNTDWAQLATGATGTDLPIGAGQGSVVATCFWQLGNVNGGASDVVSVTAGNVTMARIWEVTKTASGWVDPVGTVLLDTDESGTGVSATNGVTLDITAGDFLIINAVVKDDAISHTSQSVTVTGCTLGSVTWDAKFSTTNGSDMAQYVGTCSVSSGTASGAATYAATSNVSGGSAAAVSLIRFREITPPNVGLTVNYSAIHRASRW